MEEWGVGRVDKSLCRVSSCLGWGEETQPTEDPKRQRLCLFVQGRRGGGEKNTPGERFPLKNSLCHRLLGYIHLGRIANAEGGRRHAWEHSSPPTAAAAAARSPSTLTTIQIRGG